MRVLMLSTDESIIVSGSPTQQRMIEYGTLASELHIILYTRTSPAATPVPANGPDYSISKNVFVYTTKCRDKTDYFQDAYKIGVGIVKNSPVYRRPREMVDDGQELLETVTTDIKEGKANKDELMRAIFKKDVAVSSELKKKKTSGPYRDWLVTTQDPFETAQVGYRLKKHFRIPLQIQVHTDFLSPYFRAESFKNRVRAFFARRVIRKADCLRVVSERIKNGILNQGLLADSHVPVTVLPILVEPPKNVLPIFADIKRGEGTSNDLRRKYPRYDFIILTAARLTREKNIDVAIQAMKRVVPEYPRTLLLIVGRGPEEAWLKSRAEKLKDNVIFEPWVDDLVPYYKTADLFLLTSDYEGYGRTVVEAQLYSLPVLMTNVGCAGELIQNGRNGMVVPVGDVRRIAQSIGGLIEHPKTLARLAKNSKDVVSLLPTREQYLEQYRNALLSCHF